jgi:hypothetical protein
MTLNNLVKRLDRLTEEIISTKQTLNNLTKIIAEE